jgi:hypothetical protein
MVPNGAHPSALTSSDGRLTVWFNFQQQEQRARQDPCPERRDGDARFSSAR